MKKLNLVVIMLVAFLLNCATSGYIVAYEKKEDGIPKKEITVNSRVVSIKGPITMDLADKVCQKIINYNVVSETIPIYMFIDSPGGFVDAGLKIIAIMKATKAPIKGIVVNWCMSMAVYIFNTCDERYAFENSDFLIHNIQLTVFSAPCHEVLRFAEMAVKHNMFLLNMLNGTLELPLSELIMASSMEWLFGNKTAWHINLIQGQVTKLKALDKETIKEIFFKKGKEDMDKALEKEIKDRHKRNKEFIILTN